MGTMNGGWYAMFDVQGPPRRPATRDEIAEICKGLGWQIEQFDAEEGWALIRSPEVDARYDHCYEIQNDGYRVEVP